MSYDVCYSISGFQNNELIEVKIWEMESICQSLSDSTFSDSRRSIEEEHSYDIVFRVCFRMDDLTQGVLLEIFF
jgi:hypothetical protein